MSDDHDRFAGAQFADPEVRAAYAKANYERGWNDARDELTARAERAEAAIRESLSRPDVVEAAAREQYEYWMNTASNRAPAWDREPEDTREVHREAARAALSAAFLAALDSTETVEAAPEGQQSLTELADWEAARIRAVREDFRRDDPSRTGIVSTAGRAAPRPVTEKERADG